MRMNRQLPILGMVLLLVMGFAVFTGSPLYGDKVLIPGDVSRICYYSNFFYNFPNEDFIYYLNDRLLFFEKPEEKIMMNGIRHRLLQVLAWHEAIHNYVQLHSQEGKASVVFNLQDSSQYKKASKLILLLGYKLEENDKKQHYLTPINAPGVPDYMKFSLIRPETLEQQMNKTQYLTFHLKESDVPISGNLSMSFLREVTGIQLNSLNFFRTMLKNERFSLLLSVLFRLSGREIQFIDRLSTGAWKEIYNNKKFLMGLYVLSSALRVEKQGDALVLKLPGGDAARDFWTHLAGADLNAAPFDFLRNLVTKDNGKLNYLYVFSYFLTEDVRKALFYDYDAARMSTVYQLIKLTDGEKLSESAFPALSEWNYFTMMYALKAKDGKLLFPQGVKAWYNVVVPHGEYRYEESSGVPVTANSVIEQLLMKSPPGNGKKVTPIRTFMALYTKFCSRPELLGNGTLAKLYKNYPRYNGVVDYIERIPIKKHETVTQLFNWIELLEERDDKEKQLFTVIYQGLFEVLAFTAKYAPDRYDFDMLISELIKLPLNRGQFYHQLFRLLDKKLGIRWQGKTLEGIMMSGISNPSVKVGSTNTRYRFMIRNSFKRTVDRILQSQEVCSFNDFLKINRLISDGQRLKPPATTQVGTQLVDSFNNLPFPGISSEAPRSIRSRVISYPIKDMRKDIKSFVEAIHVGAEQKKLDKYAIQLKGDYLIYQFRDYLLALVYAIHAKDAKIKAFYNPNFARLHEIAEEGIRSLWDNFAVRKRKTKTSDSLAGYHLSGPLCRMKVDFASRWQTHLFRENILHNPEHVQSVISNLLEFYPLPMVDKGMAYNALLVDLGLELLRQARGPGEEEEGAASIADTEVARTDVIRLLGNVTAGYHYRRGVFYVTRQSDYQNLFLSELRRLGEEFIREPGLHDAPYTDRLDTFKKLTPFLAPQMSAKIKKEMHRFGSIYAHTYGNLEPRQIRIFPQEVSNLLEYGWVSGSMVDEFKVKLGYHLHKKKVPASLLGQFLYMYLNKTGKRFLRQNHYRDYAITYFVFDIFNNSHLKRLIKQLEKEGNLKLQ